MRPETLCGEQMGLEVQEHPLFLSVTRQLPWVQQLLPGSSKESEFSKAQCSHNGRTWAEQGRGLELQKSGENTTLQPDEEGSGWLLMG